jgi:acyl-CoA synthetase (AMP-forming)/AMP-acid ligase II
VSLYWGLGCENALFNIMTHGATLVLQEHFEPGEALHLISQERCTLFYGTPNMAQALYEHPDREGCDLSTCLRSGGTVGTPEQILRVVDLGAKDICHIYGLTETYGNCCVTDAGDPLERRLTTVGRPLPGVDLRIVDAESNDRAGSRKCRRDSCQGLRDRRLLQGYRRRRARPSTPRAIFAPAISACSTTRATSSSAAGSRR